MKTPRATSPDSQEMLLANTSSSLNKVPSPWEGASPPDRLWCGWLPMGAQRVLPTSERDRDALKTTDN